jgi:hypothetical protein
MRDKDANTAWATAAADGTLEERRVYCQNWRADGELGRLGRASSMTAPSFSFSSGSASCA